MKYTNNLKYGKQKIIILLKHGITITVIISYVCDDETIYS